MCKSARPQRRVLFFTLFAASIFCFWAGILPAQTGFVFSEHKSRVDIPFDFSNNFMLIHLRINHLLPITFLFDTGAESNILTRRDMSDLLQMSYTRRYKMQGADLGDTLVAYLTRDVRLDLSQEVGAPHEDLLVLEEDYFRFEQYTGVPVYGILSAVPMSGYLIEIDYARQRLRLHRPASYDPAVHGFTAIPIEMHRNKPYAMFKVSVAPDSTVLAKLLLDTGAALPLLLFHNTHPLLAPPGQTIPSQIAMGIGGYLEGYTGRVARVDIGAFTQENVVAYFQEIDSLHRVENLHGRHGLIGNLFFRHFKVIFDYPNKTMWLKPAKNYADGYQFDRSGMYLMSTGAAEGALLVQFVVPGSPAQEAGIRRGDQLLKAGTLSGNPENLAAINLKLQKRAGKTVHLRLFRDGQVLEKKIVLRDLL
ncbi:MAG: hypothetical protein ACOYNO_09510 [Saprospiraceae bacterium]